MLLTLHVRPIYSESLLERLRADTAMIDSGEHFTNIEEKYGDRWLLFHRADLHAGLKAVVEAQKPPVKVRLGTSVVDVDAAQGILELASGERV